AALGAQAGALAAGAEAEQAGPSPDVVDLFNPVGAQRVRLLVAQGQLAQAAAWVAARGLDPGDQASYPREREYLLLARLLIAQNQPERALSLLRRLDDAAGGPKRTGSPVGIGTGTGLALGGRCPDGRGGGAPGGGPN